MGLNVTVELLTFLFHFSEFLDSNLSMDTGSYYRGSCGFLPYLQENYGKKRNKLHNLSPRANYTDRATAACRRSDCQLLRIEGATWSA
jgi:hypothetical protein